MTIQGHRSERIAEEIRNEVSLMLAGELKDPRLAAPVMVTEVRMGAGMRTVRVFVSLAGDEAERATTLEGLQAAKGYVRHELVERLHMRRAPEVLFILDETEEYGNRIENLLRKAKNPRSAVREHGNRPAHIYFALAIGRAINTAHAGSSDRGPVTYKTIHVSHTQTAAR